jgi:hypothetical protein
MNKKDLCVLRILENIPDNSQRRSTCGGYSFSPAV